MNINNILSITGVVAILSIGQVLFKKASISFPNEITIINIIKFIFSPYLISACFLYASATLFWVYILRTVPLNKAYPLIALSFVIVPIISYFFLKETLSIRYGVGIIFILIGISLTGVAR